MRDESQDLEARSSLLAIVAELERGVQAMSAALEQVRGTVELLAAHAARSSPATRSATPTSAPRLSLVKEPAVPAYELPAADPSPQPDWQDAEAEAGEAALATAGPPDEDALMDAAVSRDEEAALASAGFDDEEAAREEVRRAVEKARAELSWRNQRVDAGLTPGGAADTVAPWLRDEVVEDEASPPQPDVEELQQALLDDLRREEVRQAVERSRKEMETGSPERIVVDPEEAVREEVRRTVEDARGALDWSQLKPDSGFNLRFDRGEAGRVDRQWEVEEPQEAGQPRPSDQPQESGQSQESEAVALHDGAGLADDAMPTDSLSADVPEVPEGAGLEEPNATAVNDEARREEVRRAVEAARAEAVGGDVQEAGAAARAPLMTMPETTRRGQDFSGPPILVIEDPEGRVELAQVFATMSRVDRANQAALLNYSPHSVTIGLDLRSGAPDPEELIRAAEAVFGRVCRIKSDGSRTAIEIGSERVRS